MLTWQIPLVMRVQPQPPPPPPPAEIQRRAVTINCEFSLYGLMMARLASLLSPLSSLRTLVARNSHFSHIKDNTCLTTLCIDFHERSDFDLQLPAVVKIVKYNKTLLHMKLGIGFTQEEHSHAFLSAVSDALQKNTTLQSLEVKCHYDLSQHRAFTLDSRLVWQGLLVLLV